MCGRFAPSTLNDNNQLIEIFPTNNYKVKTKDGVCEMKWGIKTDWGLIINARQETVNEKKIFKDDFQKRRCVIEVTCFYEWDKYKNKYKVIQNNQSFVLAGFYKINRNSKEFVILTQEAVNGFEKLHSRQPYILGDKEINEYLNSDSIDKWIVSKKI